MCIKRYSAVLLCLFFSGCSLLYPTKTPIDSVYYRTGKEPSDAIIIMLPGRGDGPEDYVNNGFIKILNESITRPDAIVVDAHFGYYYGRNLIPRLYEDVIIPAGHKGYKNIWLVGISMGGLGALLYAKEHPDTIKGIFVLAPFLGDKDVIQEISHAGGLAKWTPVKSVSADDYQRQLWMWLKGYVEPKKEMPRLVIGWGKDDKFAYTNELLAAALPDSRAYTAPGRHDWDTWANLFRQFLESGIMSGGK
jgi:pimeloyl-ACP methyl ester carboxylesterase